MILAKTLLHILITHSLAVPGSWLDVLAEIGGANGVLFVLLAGIRQVAVSLKVKKGDKKKEGCWEAIKNCTGKLFEGGG